MENVTLAGVLFDQLDPLQSMVNSANAAHRSRLLVKWSPGGKYPCRRH